MNVAMRVLLVEDNQAYADLIQDELTGGSDGFEVERASHLRGALETLEHERIDAILLDLGLPDSGGLNTLTRVKRSAPSAAIVVLTADDDRMTAVGAHKHGAQDYLVKGQADADDVARALRAAVERRRTEEQLRRSEARLAEAQALAHLGSFEWDLSTGELIGSEQLRRMLALPYTRTFGARELLLSRVDPADRGAAEAWLESLVLGQRPDEIEFRLRDGSAPRFVRARAEVIVDAEGIPHVAGTLQDITERKKLEEQFLFAGRLAAVGTLASGVAHEINNPLAYVLANLDLAVHASRELGKRISQLESLVDRAPRMPIAEAWERCGETDPEDAIAALSTVLAEARDGAERVKHIVRDLKMFARSEEDHCASIRLEKILESSINMASNQIRHRARLVKELDEVPLVRANASRLGQVFLNLLINAAEAIPEGDAAHHRIRVATRKGPVGEAIVEVQDSGAGIRPDVMERLFDPFFTTKPVGTGTGLGLAISRSIVEALGGRIEVQSELGRGSTFRVVLPAAKEEPAAREAAPARAGRHGGRGANGHDGAAPDSPLEPRRAHRRGRVLLVDDDVMVLTALKRMLSQEHDVTAVSRAADALGMLTRGERFDAVLTDLMMPELTGMDLYEELQRAVPEQATRMVFLTGGAFTPRAREFLDRVPNPRLEKPFDLETLRAVVSSFVR